MAGDGTLSSAKMVVGGAEGQYTVAKTSVWWDIENCHVPKGFDAHGIAQNISSALVKMNYCGPVSISAYGDTNKIPPAVQQALNSTGISLNHVPAGVKDASDKKILVDMLFWAVDNPAPANYLLISGDRDFSNALHQLRMRRYNVLLAQPLKASTALVAAAKSVWCWTSLLAGGSPLTSGESSQLANSNNTFNPEILRDPVPDIFPKNQAAYSKSESISLRNQNFFIPVEVGDAKDKGKYVLKNPNQPGITKASSMPVAIHESNYFTNINQPESAQAKQFKRAPHEFFGTTEPFLASRSDHLGLGNIGNFNIKDDLHKQYTQPQPVFAPDGLSRLDSYNNAFRPVAQKHDGPRFSSAPLTNVPNIGKLGMSEESNYFRNPPNFYREVGGDYKPKSMESPNLARPCVPQKGDISHTSQPVSHDILGNRNPHVFDVPEVSSFSHITISTNSIHGVQCQPPPEYIQGLIGVILLALNSLKLEKLMPTETNIKDCIRYGDPKFRNTDVKKALECALEHKMILKQNLGAVWLYVGRMERLWKCVNPIGGNQNQYSKATWDAIQEFLTSSDGRSAIMASECRYEAALILKNACLKYLALGEVLQILNMIIDVKRWITHSQLGWQPITVTLAESKSDAELHPQFSNDLIKVMELKLSAIEHRSAHLQGLISQPEASPVEYARANKELRKLSSSMDLINELRAKQKEIEGLNSLKSECQEDKDMQAMVIEELGQAMEDEKKLQNLLLKSLLPKDDADERDCILEVRAGTGGEEASLFAMDIFKMYERYSLNNGWKFEVVDVTDSDLKGFKEASAAISGADVYGRLKFESGIHRVQRVPVTEKSGRVHTSAVSVAILPQADEVDVHLRNEDLRIDTYRSGGSGGQHANTTNSAVRITHIPSGLTVAIQDERSQHMNKAKALKVLCAKLYEVERYRIRTDRSKLRMEQIGSGDRSERIRTYNFPQGRVTDHRVGITHHSINDVMQGENLDIFIDALLLQQEMNAMASFGCTQ